MSAAIEFPRHLRPERGCGGDSVRLAARHLNTIHYQGLAAFVKPNGAGAEGLRRRSVVDVSMGPGQVREALEASGRRCTRQRLAVHAALTSADDHPTAEQLYRTVKGEIPDISLATVYKALDALVASGLAERLRVSEGTGPARYDARQTPHYHLRCTRTGRVCDLPTHYDPDLPTKLDPQLEHALHEAGFRLTGYRLELVGYFEDGSEAKPLPEGPA